MHSKNKELPNLTPSKFSLLFFPHKSKLHQSNSSSNIKLTQKNMSLQAQPQQPTQVYPTTITNQPQNSHHSNGSFGTVFIVLAIILVISVVACVLGRLCNKRYNKNQSYNHHHNQSQSQRNHVKPNRQQIHHMQSPREEDIEFGVENNHKRIPTIATRPNINGHGAGTGPTLMQPHHHGNGNNIKGFEIKQGQGHGHEAELREYA